MCTRVFHKLAELAETFEEGDHGGVEFAVQEAKVDGEVAGGVEFEAVAGDGG